MIVDKKIYTDLNSTNLSYMEYVEHMYWSDMVQYFNLTKNGDVRLGVIEHVHLKFNSSTQINYLEENGFDVSKYYKSPNAHTVLQIIYQNENKIIKSIDVLIEEKKAILTFFDKSRQLVDFQNHDIL